MNRKKSNLIGYVWGIHTDMEVPKTGNMMFIEARRDIGSEDTKEIKIISSILGERTQGLENKGCSFI